MNKRMTVQDKINSLRIDDGFKNNFGRIRKIQTDYQ